MPDFVGVAEAARIVGESVRRVSDGFYKAWFDDSQCPVIAGRRTILRSYLPTLAAIMRDRRRNKSGRSPGN